MITELAPRYGQVAAQADAHQQSHQEGSLAAAPVRNVAVKSQQQHVAQSCTEGRALLQAQDITSHRAPVFSQVNKDSIEQTQHTGTSSNPASEKLCSGFCLLVRSLYPLSAMF